MCDKTQSMWVWHDSIICVTWLNHMCDMRVTWLMITWRMCDVTQSCLWYECDMTQSYVWHDPIMSVTWLNHMWNMCVTWLIHLCHVIQTCKLQRCFVTCRVVVCIYINIYTYIFIWRYCQQRAGWAPWMPIHIYIYIFKHLYIYTCTYILYPEIRSAQAGWEP